MFKYRSKGGWNSSVLNIDLKSFGLVLCIVEDLQKQSKRVARTQILDLGPQYLLQLDAEG